MWGIGLVVTLPYLYLEAMTVPQPPPSPPIEKSNSSAVTHSVTSAAC